MSKLLLLIRFLAATRQALLVGQTVARGHAGGFRTFRYEDIEDPDRDRGSRPAAPRIPHSFC